MAINAIAPGVLAEEARKLGSLLVHYSTEYIFDGNKNGSYVEDDLPNPLSVYGKSKLAGERAIRHSGCNHLILRTSWVYGARGKNFMLTMLRLAKERTELRVVDDQIGAPTGADHWPKLPHKSCLSLISQVQPRRDQHVSGTYHLTRLVVFPGMVLQQKYYVWPTFSPCQQCCDPLPGIPTPAVRPINSVLSNDKLMRTFGLSAGDWHHNLQLCLQEANI